MFSPFRSPALRARRPVHPTRGARPPEHHEEAPAETVQATQTSEPAAAPPSREGPGWSTRYHGGGGGGGGGFL